MIKKLLLMFIILFSLSQSINPTVLNVPSDYSSIQSAINSSVNGDTILVAPGNYLENINFTGKNILVTNHYILNNDINARIMRA